MKLNICCRCWLIVLSFNLTSEMNESIESDCSPVPLCFPVFLMVLQISPGRWSVWIFGWGPVSDVVTLLRLHGGGYNFLTIGRLSR